MEESIFIEKKIKTDFLVKLFFLKSGKSQNETHFPNIEGGILLLQESYSRGLTILF